MGIRGLLYYKDAFLGKVTPAYLLHSLPAPRNALDLLPASLDRPARPIDDFPAGEMGL